MKIKILGGKEEIGGNKILISDNNTNILLDFGMSYSKYKHFFSEYVQPRKCASLRDFLEFDLLPNLTGIYREDYLRHMGRDCENKFIDALFLSHAHMDHSAYIHFLRRDIPIYCTEPTKIIMQCIEQTSNGSYCDFHTYCETFTFYKNKKGNLSRVTKKNQEFNFEREYIVMNPNNIVEVGSLKIEMIPVDHSLPGACGFIIYSDEGNLVYTGDLRFHGWQGEKTQLFTKKASDATPEFLLCEGTRINEDRGKTETEVKTEISNIISKTKGIVFVEYPKKDIDRILTIYEATEMNNRDFVIDLKLAFLIQQLGKISPLNIENLKILIPKRSWGLIENNRYSKDQIEKDYDIWQREFIFRDNAIKCEDIKKNPSKYVISLSYWDITQLIDIQPKNSSWIKSTCEPFSEDMELDEKRKKHWLEHFGISEFFVHASGHASGHEIIQMIKCIKPKKLLPIHTEYPELFSKIKY